MGQCALDSRTFLLCSGPEQWTGDCKKNQQSPINIVTSKTKLNPSLTPFTFVGYDQKKKWEVKNNQHSGGSCVGWVEPPGRANRTRKVSPSGLEMGGATRETCREEDTLDSCVFSHFIRTVGVRGGNLPGRRERPF